MNSLFNNSVQVKQVGHSPSAVQKWALCPSTLAQTASSSRAQAEIKKEGKGLLLAGSRSFLEKEGYLKLEESISATSLLSIFFLNPSLYPAYTTMVHRDVMVI